MQTFSPDKTYSLLDPLPDDSGHLISIHINDWVGNLNLLEWSGKTSLSSEVHSVGNLSGKHLATELCFKDITLVFIYNCMVRDNILSLVTLQKSHPNYWESSFTRNQIKVVWFNQILSKGIGTCFKIEICFDLIN